MTNPHLLNIMGYGGFKIKSVNSIAHLTTKDKEENGRVKASGEGFSPPYYFSSFLVPQTGQSTIRRMPLRRMGVLQKQHRCFESLLTEA